MEDRKVSIVLPVYNGEKHVYKSIDSILAQTYSNWELIIVNDCSTDNTLAIVNEYAQKDSRIRVFSNETNLKLPKTLNAGFSRANGDYYTWTSDDNMYKPTAINVLASYLSEHSDVSMVYSDYTNIDDSDNELYPGILSEPERLAAGNVCGASFMYTAEIAEKVGNYDEEMFLAEDYDYWLRIFFEGKIAHIKDNLYLYRRHSESLTETKRDMINGQTLKVIEKNMDNLLAGAAKYKLTYELFDHIMKRCEEEKRDEMLNRLLKMDSGYKRYLFIKKVKKIIKGK